MEVLHILYFVMYDLKIRRGFFVIYFMLKETYQIFKKIHFHLANLQIFFPQKRKDSNSLQKINYIKSLKLWDPFELVRDL